MSEPLKVVCAFDASGKSPAQYKMATGEVFFVDHRGWVFDINRKSVRHDLVDHVMDAILAWEAR